MRMTTAEPISGSQSVSDDEIDRALAACGGDPRETIRALLVGQEYLEREISRLVSRGYCRRIPLDRMTDVEIRVPRAGDEG